MAIIKKQSRPKTSPLTLKNFYEKRNKVLIWHDKGGLGDVLMQRMMFRDFKKINPEMNLIFACLPEYMDAVKDHPDISSVIDSRHVNPNDYCTHYNTCVTIADRYENIRSPFCKDHRSDIWAKYCGVDLTEHDMLFNLDRGLIEKCRKRLQSLSPKEDRPIVLFSPVSKMVVKSLLKWQIEAIKDATKETNLVGLHNREVTELTQLDIPAIYDANIKEWMCYIAAADYVIAVDTAAFHMAGGLKKPLVGIFTFADGKVYGKHFDFVLVQKHRDNGNWDCGPCFTYASCPKCNKAQKPCLTEITKEELQTGVQQMFERWPLIKDRK